MKIHTSVLALLTLAASVITAAAAASHSYIYFPLQSGGTDYTLSSYVQDWRNGYGWSLTLTPEPHQFMNLIDNVNTTSIFPGVPTAGFEGPGTYTSSRKLVFKRGKTSWANPWLETVDAEIMDWWLYEVGQNGSHFFRGSRGNGMITGSLKASSTLDRVNEVVSHDFYHEQVNRYYVLGPGWSVVALGDCYNNLIGGEVWDDSTGYKIKKLDTVTFPGTSMFEMPPMTIATVDGQVVRLNLSPLPGSPAGGQFKDVNGPSHLITTDFRSAYETINGQVTPGGGVLSATTDGFAEFNSRFVVWYNFLADQLAGINNVRDSYQDWLDANGYTTTTYPGAVQIGTLNTYEVVEVVSPPGIAPENVFQVASELGSVVVTKPIYVVPPPCP